MPYGDLLADVVQGSVANTPPAFRDGNGTQVGTLCRAWVNFNGTGTVEIRASFNVSSITDNGTGDYTINFTTAMPDANYSAVFNSSGPNAGAVAIILATLQAGVPTLMTTTQIRVICNNASSSFDHNVVTASIFR